jgi:hypothetical protein
MLLWAVVPLIACAQRCCGPSSLSPLFSYFLHGLLRCCCGPLSLSLLMLSVVGCRSSPLATLFFLWAVADVVVGHRPSHNSCSALLWAVILPLLPPIFSRHCCGMSFFPSHHLSLTPLVHLFLDVVVGCRSSPLVIQPLVPTPPPSQFIGPPSPVPLLWTHRIDIHQVICRLDSMSALDCGSRSSC